VAADGTIRTGAHRDRVPAIFEPVMNNSGTVLVPAVSVLSQGSVAARPTEYRSEKAMFAVR
jgi:hypothetical protein